MSNGQLVGIVVPVRDEAELLGPCLHALGLAVAQAYRAGVDRIQAVVVLDCCSDASRQVATTAADTIGVGAGRRHPWLAVLDSSAGKVGAARRIGMESLLADLLPGQGKGIWLATTDADSQVPSSWLTHQLGRQDEGYDAWTGTVVVDDWIGRSSRLPDRFVGQYEQTPTGHVHGASMGFRAEAYRRAGGFPAVATAEDHRLWERLGAVGAHRICDPGCPVTTSARRRGRAPDGFADALDRMERELEDVD